MSHFIAPERRAAGDFVLRAYAPGDGRLLSDAVNESYQHLAPWMPWATEEQSVEESEQIVRRFRARYLLSEDFVVGVFSPDEARLLGSTGFHLREGPIATLCAETGMFIRASEAGSGLGTRVLRAMLAWGFDAWPWLRISWWCDSRNVASARCAEKAGMLREGLLRGQAAHVGDGRRDTCVYAALKGEWLDPGRAR